MDRTEGSSRDGAVIVVLMVGAIVSLLAAGRSLAGIVPDYLAEGTAVALWSWDVANYWFAPRLALEGDWATLADADAYIAVQERLAGSELSRRNWSYPPTMLLVLLPLGLMSLKAATAAFIVVTTLLFAWAAEAARRALVPDAPRWTVAVATLAAFAVNVPDGQNGMLTGAILLAVAANWHGRPVLAGLILGLIVVKPHLGILFPIAAVLDRNWRLIGATIVSAGGLVLASFVAFGTEAWRSYAEIIVPYQADLPFHWGGWFHYKMLGAMGWAIREGAASSAWALHAPFALVALLATVWAWSRSDGPQTRLLVLLVATLLALPYAFDYDMAGALALAVLAAPALGGLRGTTVALLAVVPTMLAPLQWATGAPVATVILLAVLVAASLPRRVERLATVSA